MDQMKTGGLIRTLRRRRGLTQLALAERLGVSDKAVSKWERGRGAPDIALLPSLSEALGVDTKALLRGDLEENEMTNGNMKRTRFYVCPDCGSLLLSTESGELTCCGRRLSPRYRRRRVRTGWMPCSAMGSGTSPAVTKCAGSTIYPFWRCSPGIRC